ncbi:MAG: AAA family ATPase, partial [Chloroflexales bacterium]|nr:AAA family ATPase [Chloroflexales bacterium]
SQAVELYRGNFLAGFALRDSLPFEEWQLVQQEALHRQAVESLFRLVTYYAGRGEHDLVQRSAGRLVALDPWHEQGLLQLMRSLAQTGQGAAALDQYARYRETLHREFALPPSAEVTVLSEQIQARQIGGPPISRPAAAQIAPAPRPQGERRQITALICSWHDAGGYGDPEDLEQQLAHYEAWLQTLLDRYGGYGPQRQGDEWLVYFGYPQAYEDAARRAVHVGLALLSATHGADTVRVAIHTDIMVVGDGEPFGDVPRVARIGHSLAEPGTLLISAATERLVRRWFSCRSLGPLLRTGAAQPSEAFQVLGQTVARHHFDSFAQIAHLTPLAGREHELAQLSALLVRAVQGQGAIVMLSGDPGLGKSRLLWDLRLRWGDSVTWLEGRCSSYFQNTHLYPVIGLLEDALGIADGDSPEARLAQLASSLARYGLDQTGSLWLLSMLLGLPTELPAPQPITAQQRERMREVMVALFQRAAARRPLVLAIEDLHWADPSTIVWLGASLAALAATPCLTLLTCRPTFQPPWPPSPHMSAITLGPLHASAVERMVADLTRTAALPPVICRHIINQSDGVPLFVEELTK